MDNIRSKKLVLKLRVDELIIAEKNWILSHIKAQLKPLSLTESMQLAIRIQQKATIEMFKLHPGGITNAEYAAEHMETRAKVLGNIISKEELEANAGHVPRQQDKLNKAEGQRVNATFHLAEAQSEVSECLGTFKALLRDQPLSEMQRLAQECIQEIEIRNSQRTLGLSLFKGTYGQTTQNCRSWKPQAIAGRPKRGHKLPRKTRRGKIKIAKNEAKWIDLSRAVQEVYYMFHYDELEQDLAEIFEWDMNTEDQQISEERLQLLEPQLDLEDEIEVVDAGFYVSSGRSNA